MKIQLIYIGREITLNILEKTVAEQGLGSNNTILLNPQDFNTIALEHTQTFEEMLPKPFIVHGIAVEKDTEGKIPYGSIGII